MRYENTNLDGDFVNHYLQIVQEMTRVALLCCFLMADRSTDS